MAVSHANPKSNLAVANKRSAKVSYAKQHPQRMVHFFSLSAFETTTTSKIGSLYPSKGFLLYIRDIVKITKVTNIN